MSASRDRGTPVPAPEPGSAGPTDADLARFRQTMGRWATGVSVITTVSAGHDHAMTASALTSVSLDPMLVLVCVEIEARFHDAVLDAGFFGASILAVDQRPAADWFATRGRPVHGQLDRTEHYRGPLTGAALLAGSLATLECRVHAVHPGGDHSVVVAEVLGIELPADAGDALVYYRGRYGSLA